MTEVVRTTACGDAPIRGAHVVRGTLDAALAHAVAHGVDVAGAPGDPRPAHAEAPSVGSRTVVSRTVGPDHTAAAIGHPDESVDVLSTPTIALWFELAASQLMPAPGGAVRHVGVGILVHHLDVADVGQDVEVTAEVSTVDGRSVRFRCHASCEGRLLATGDHQRMVVVESD